MEEMALWYKYRNHKLLPHRRLEFYMAQLTLHVSALGMLWGGAKYSFNDFLFDEKMKQKQDTAENAAPVLGAMSGVRVVKLGQRRKHG